MDISTVLMVIIIIAFIFIYLMNVRIRQLDKELYDLKSRVTITDDELTRLIKDVEDFKKLII